LYSLREKFKVIDDLALTIFNELFDFNNHKPQRHEIVQKNYWPLRRLLGVPLCLRVFVVQVGQTATEMADLVLAFCAGYKLA
jgi:hypothetical protein